MLQRNVQEWEEKTLRYQMVCVDLDGTLLDDQKCLPEKNQEALRNLWQDGVEICIASGRSPISAESYLTQMGITGSVVALNGGLVRAHGKEIAQSLMERASVEAVIGIAETYGVYTYLNDGEQTFVINEPEAEFRKRLAGNPKLSESFQPVSADEMRNLLASGQARCMKISMREDDLTALERLRETILTALLTGIQTAKSDINYLDVFPKGRSKWSGIEQLLSHFGIAKECCVCFGDNENDREMLAEAGLGIAMGNAQPDLKMKADFVTLTNQECGVAYGIHTWVEEKGR